MTTSDKYNGWTNWHTWNCYLWLSSFERHYNCTRLAGDALEIKEWWKQYMEGQDDIETDLVNFEEIYQAFNEE